MSMINKEISEFRTYAYHENEFKLPWFFFTYGISSIRFVPIAGRKLQNKHAAYKALKR